MRRSNSKRFVALFLALTVFFTSGFFVMFSMDVFGAKNKDVGSTYSYVDETRRTAHTVGVRGSAANNADIILTDEGSNVQGKTPDYSYNSWNPNDYKSTNSTSDLPVIPATNGAKGTKNNPFVILEVVPDKAMQEMSYYAGDEESGLPFSQADLSATMMMRLREEYASDDFMKNIRFTDKQYSVASGNDTTNFISNNIVDKLKTIFGQWGLKYDYSVFETGTDQYNKTTKLFDCTEKDASSKEGSFNFNEIYNKDITDDDLLDTYPSSWTAPTMGASGEDYSYNEIRAESPKNSSSMSYVNSSDGYNKYSNGTRMENSKQPGKVSLYFTDDLIYLARRSLSDSTNVPTRQQVIDFVKNTILEKDSNNKYKIKFDFATVNPTNINGNRPKDDTSASSTQVCMDIKKYNLQDFVKAAWAAKNTFVAEGMSEDEAQKKANKVAMDVTSSDMSVGGFDTYEASMGIFARGSGGYTYSFDINSTNYWKMLFRKYYVDRFEELYADFEAKQKEWNEVAASEDALSTADSDKLKLRNEALAKLFNEYEPLFTRKGITIKSMGDTYDWEVTKSSTVSNNRYYQARSQGGYIVAVKPGKGHLYLLKPKEVKALMDNMTADEIKNSGISEKSFIFTSDYKNLDGDKAESEYSSRKRWMYVSWRWGLEGDARASTSNNYRAGLLDDYDYTNGFASKSVVNYDNYWMAIYDRKNRRFHGTKNNRSENIKAYDRFGYDKVSYKMLEKTDTISELTTYQRRHDGNPYFTFYDLNNNANKWIEVYDSAANDAYLSWSRTDPNTPGQALFPVDDYHLNILSSIKQYWGLDDNSQEIKNIKENNNLINGSNSGGASWYGWFYKDGSNYHKNFIYNSDGNKALTGLTLNFNSDDVYSYEWLKTQANKGGISKARFDSTSVNQWDGIDKWRYTPGGGSGDVKNENSDQVSTVDKTQIVKETGNKYHFTYYGFDTADILKSSLFTFTDKSGSTALQQYNNYCYKVICVTPKEINEIAQIAKEQNVTKSSANASDKDVKLDLIERADMFYIHTHKNRTISSQDHYKEAYRFYLEVVEGKSVKQLVEAEKKRLRDEGKDEEANALTEDKYLTNYGANTKTFYQNDIAWEQVLKLIKRSSLRHGINIPILYNSLVQTMSEESVDPDKTNGEYDRSSAVEDTRMYLMKDQNNNEKNTQWAGNVNNIAKLFLVTIQFDLHTTKNKVITQAKEVTDENGNKSIVYETQYDEFGNPRVVKRTFMQDIYPYLLETPIESEYLQNSYGASDLMGVEEKSAVALRASSTGTVYAKGDEGASAKAFTRELTGQGGYSEAFKRNSVSLWNRYTFFPTGSKKVKAGENQWGAWYNYYPLVRDDDWASFVEYGYLYSYWYGDDNVFADQNGTAGTAKAYKYRVGTNGTDYQNIYVLHQPNDVAGEHGDSFISDYGQGSAHITDFLKMAFTIMNYPGDPDKLQIKTIPRADKKYTLLGNFGELDQIMYEFTKNKSDYPTETINKILTEERNILIRIINPNNVDDCGYVTHIYKQKGEDESTRVEIPLTDIYVGKTGDEKVSKLAATRTYSNVLDKNGESHNLSYDIFEIPGGGDAYYYRIPYTLEDYFNDSEGRSYNKIIIKGDYLFNNVKEHTMSVFDVTHTIDITEKELPMLE